MWTYKIIVKKKTFTILLFSHFIETYPQPIDVMCGERVFEYDADHWIDSNTL